MERGVNLQKREGRLENGPFHAKPVFCPPRHLKSPAMGRMCRKSQDGAISDGKSPERPKIPRSRSELRPRGFTITEIVISVGILLFLISLGLRSWQLFRGKTSENLSKRLLLQMEARRALLQLYRLVQEGVEVVSPLPGATLPYLVFKDGLNDIRMLFLEQDDQGSKEEGTQVFRLMVIRRDIGKNLTEPPKCLMEHVVRLTFTTYHPGGVLISAVLRGGKGEFAFVNFVRLQNHLCDDGP